MPISKEMQLRLARIDEVVEQGFIISKVYGAFPQLAASNGSVKNIFLGPAGFSWIAFFFPSAVCAQIKEWSYFYVLAVTALLLSIISKVTGWPLSYAGNAIAVTYAFYYPYLRWLANKNKREELGIASSIFIGLTFSILSIVPSLMVDFS